MGAASFRSWQDDMLVRTCNQSRPFELVGSGVPSAVRSVQMVLEMLSSCSVPCSVLRWLLSLGMWPVRLRDGILLPALFLLLISSLIPL